MAYVRTGNSGLGRLRNDDRIRNGDRDIIALSTPMPSTDPSYQPPPIIGPGGVRPITVEETMLPLIHPAIPGTHPFEVEDTRFITDPLPPTIPADTRMTEVSYPIETASAKLAFELAEAKKYGYTHEAWMAMGTMARVAVRAKYPGGYDPTTRDGTSATAAEVTIISGRDPIRSRENYAGAGDYEGGMEIREPIPSVPLKTTRTGITFDDLIKIDPTKIQTAEEAAGVVTAGGIPTQDYVRFGIMAVAGWILWDVFMRPKRKPARRRGSPKKRKPQYYEYRQRLPKRLKLRQGRQ